MTEKELLTAKVWFRCTPSQLERWKEAQRALGVREISDLYRDAIDSMADAVLEPEPATISGS